MEEALNKIYNLNQRKNIIIVSGLPRSGTSMMMQMLEAGGMPILTDSIRVADIDNPNNYYEYEPVKDTNYHWFPQAIGKAVKVVSMLLKQLSSEYQYKIIFMQRNLDEILASQEKMLRNRQKLLSNDESVMLKEVYLKHLVQIQSWLDEQSNMEVNFISYNEVVKQPQYYAQIINQFLDGFLDSIKMAKVVQLHLYRNQVIGL